MASENGWWTFSASVELSQQDREHIGSMIVNGFTEGEVAKDYTSQIRKVISVELGDIVGRDLESFLDMIAERAGYPNLSEINYSVIVNDGDTLLLEVTGYDFEEDGEEDNPAVQEAPEL
jgi:hypothetical protein